MRYYSIEVDGGPRYTSHPNTEHGAADPGALMVEMDIFVRTFATAASPDSFIRVWGIPLKTVAGASALNLKRIQVRGGMGKGLPLAKPAQAGLLIDGSIYKPFGNWIDTDMTLDLYVGAPQTKDIASLETPANLAFVWKKGEKLGDLMSRTLKQAFPDYEVKVSINNNLTTDHDEPGNPPTVRQFAEWANGVSKDIVGQGYTGVQVFTSGKTFRIFDNSTAANPKVIDFNDFIGQPTWLGLYNVSVTLVMRADINPGDIIRMPTTVARPTQAAVVVGDAASRQSIAIQGDFQVLTVRHVGNSRSPDGRGWVTVLECVGGGSSTTASGASAPAQAGVPPSGLTQKRPPYTP